MLAAGAADGRCSPLWQPVQPWPVQPFGLRSIELQPWPLQPPFDAGDQWQPLGWPVRLL